MRYAMTVGSFAIASSSATVPEAASAASHSEVGPSVGRQSLAQTSRDEEGFIAVLPVHRGRRGRLRLGCIQFILQLRFKLVARGLRTAETSQPLCEGRFLKLQVEVDLFLLRAVCLSVRGREPEHLNFDCAFAGSRRGKHVAAVLIRGRDEFLSANRGRDGRAGDRLIRRLHQAALRVERRAGRAQSQENQVMLDQLFLNASTVNDERGSPAVTC